jgi:PAS domain S-box-containing protein
MYISLHTAISGLRDCKKMFQWGACIPLVIIVLFSHHLVAISSKLPALTPAASHAIAVFETVSKVMVGFSDTSAAYIPSQVLKDSSIQGVSAWTLLGCLPISAAVVISQAPMLIATGKDLWTKQRGYLLAAIFILVLNGVLMARLYVETRRRKRSDRSETRRREFGWLISEITERVTNLPTELISIEIRRGLKDLRSYLNIERVSLYFRTEDGGDFRVLSSLSDRCPPLSTARAAQFRWTQAKLRGGEPVLVDKLETLPLEAVFEKQTWEKEGVRSIAIIPIKLGHRLLAFFILAVTKYERGWPEGTVSQFQTLGDIFLQLFLRQKAEHKVFEMEQRFAWAADAAPVMIWMSGQDKQCTYFNHGWLAFTGRSLDQELGSGWLQGVHPEDADRCLTEYSRAFDARKRFRLEYRLRRADNEYRWVVDYGIPRFELGGNFCGYIGSCLDITDVKRSELELKELSSRLIGAQEDERRRIARELHDDFCQQLAILGLELAKLNLRAQEEPAVEKLIHDMEARIKNLANAMHNRAHQLHSSYIEILGLPSAIQGHCSEFSKQYKIAVDFKQGNLPAQVPSDVALCLFRIVQEGMQNIAKHSRTRTCVVELTTESDGLLLRIVDSGIGFDATKPKYKPGLGLISMRERLRQVNGQMRLYSAPRQGTQLEVRVPFKKVSATA